MTWHETEALFEDRFKRYLDDDFFEHQIHWFSIFNSFMMVLFLVRLPFALPSKLPPHFCRRQQQLHRPQSPNRLVTGRRCCAYPSAHRQERLRQVLHLLQRILPPPPPPFTPCADCRRWTRRTAWQALWLPTCTTTAAGSRCRPARHVKRRFASALPTWPMPPPPPLTATVSHASGAIGRLPLARTICSLLRSRRLGRTGQSPLLEVAVRAC